ncbi:hypothetical protein M9458_053658 [Cirrhinus mrigala]|uniref:Uncharacterized protein n=1 Tax=Cirrhinus mrigala TaxID=683832 RepID=A0ABD0MM12_CIRMR
MGSAALTNTKNGTRQRGVILVCAGEISLRRASKHIFPALPSRWRDSVHWSAQMTCQRGADTLIPRCFVPHLGCLATHIKQTVIGRLLFSNFIIRSFISGCEIARNII